MSSLVRKIKSKSMVNFSLILKDRFPEGEIYYDVIWGHFLLKLNNIYYDYNGEFEPLCPIPWNTFDEYDNLLKERIIRDCLK